MPDFPFTGFRQIPVGPDAEAALLAQVPSWSLDALPADFTGRTVGDVFRYGRERVDYRAEARGQNVYQAPARTLELGTGDCEDYALLWYAMLRLLGYRPDHLAIVLGTIIESARPGDTPLSRRVAHAVLFVKPKSGVPRLGPVILDNRLSLTKQPDYYRGFLFPYQGMNETGAWLYLPDARERADAHRDGGGDGPDRGGQRAVAEAGAS